MEYMNHNYTFIKLFYILLIYQFHYLFFIIIFYFIFLFLIISQKIRTHGRFDVTKNTLLRSIFHTLNYLHIP